MTRPANRLAKEKSPYLLQHAHNPVDWFPWGEEAFEKARLEQKPVFLSVGYSTCHWCHVMERESFEDQEVAGLLNQHYVPVKVDREERPDIDMVYMNVCQALTGSGGWPLNVFLAPDKTPFFTGSYFPKQSAFGRMGLLDLLPRIRTLWDERRDDVLRQAGEIVSELGAFQDKDFREEDELPGLKDAEEAYAQLHAAYDQEFGGFGSAPKFPSPHNLLFLLRLHRQQGGRGAPSMVESTLSAMRRGGLFDQVGFGFHRYSTDRKWLLPHFEKMLYDQAMLVMAYARAFQATGDTTFERTVREVIEYVTRDLAAPQGGFYSAEDADSEGVEGKFYVFSFDEACDLLEPDADVLVDYFGLKQGGNFLDESTQLRTGENVLHLPTRPEDFAIQRGIAPQQLRAMAEAARGRLFTTRGKRVRPHRDEKILTDWNGLFIAALALAGRLLQDKAFVEAAKAAMDFILSTMRPEPGVLLHRYGGSEAGISGMLDDYAFLTWGLLELHQASGEARFLDTALELAEEQIDLFTDTRRGGFYFTARTAEPLPLRPKEYYDGAMPAGNSVSYSNLTRLAALAGRDDLEDAARALLRSAAPHLALHPSGHCHLLSGLGLNP